MVVSIAGERVEEAMLCDVIHGLDVIPASVVMTANVLVGKLVVSWVVSSVEVNSFCIESETIDKIS